MTGSAIARYRQNLAAGVGTSTRRNRVLPAARLPTAIPVRIGKAGPTEEPGNYNEVDYALRVLATQNAPTYHFDMLNTPLDGSMRLYLQPRPIDTAAGDDSYYASSVRLTTTDGLLKTDYQVKLKEAIIRPASGTDKVAGFIEAPVTNWYDANDLVRGPTGVHALVRKAKTVDMVVDGIAEKLTLKPPPYTTPAGNGLCVLDEILKLGDPWHGLIQGGTVRLPNGATRPANRPGIGTGSVYALIPHGVTPAATADAADVAAGRTWLNYALLAGSCLYEQNISPAGFGWVYIAPDNSTWRVAAAHVFQSGLWNVQLQFYPLRRVFLTDDKWGGLVQTILAPINPGTTAYSNGTLYDLDSKGANAVFFKPPVSSSSGGSLVSIQGVPPAATATNTLLCDASPTGIYAMSTTTDVQTLNQKTWMYRLAYANQITQETYFGETTIYVQDQLAGDPSPLDPGFLPPPPEVEFPWTVQWVVGYQKHSFASTRETSSIVGYCFDASDGLQQAEHVTGIVAAYSEKPAPGQEWAFMPSIYFVGDGGTYNHATKIGDVVGMLAEGVWDGYSLLTLVYDRYGPLFPFYPSDLRNVEVSSIRYSNRVYGLSIKVPIENNSTDFRWGPPISPSGQSAYVLDINYGFQPFATYHPITHQIVWETGFVNFV